MKLRYRLWNTENTAHQTMATDQTKIHYTWHTNTMENTPTPPPLPPPPQKKVTKGRVRRAMYV